MKRKIFTKATPRAVEGIRRLYEGTGARIHAVVDPHTGLVSVSVDIPETQTERAAAA